MRTKPLKTYRGVETPLLGARQLILARMMIEADTFVQFESDGDVDSLGNMNGKGLTTRGSQTGYWYKITEKGRLSYIRTCNNRK